MYTTYHQRPSFIHFRAYNCSAGTKVTQNGSINYGMIVVDTAVSQITLQRDRD